MSLFSEFQSKFPAKYSGQYVEAIIKSIAQSQIDSNEKFPLVLRPFFEKLGISLKGVEITGIQSELSFEGEKQKRRADLAIDFQISNKKAGRILIEIKVDDQIIGAKFEGGNDQLDDYLGMLENTSNYFLLLTAHPVNEEHWGKVKAYGKRAQHLYLGDYCQAFSSSPVSSLEKMFFTYLTERGYVMFKPNAEEQEDFLSFMALNFLVHAHGHGRVVSERKISNGPVVFSKLVQNWQLISNRLMFKNPTIPAIRYLPEQIMKSGYKAEALEDFVEHSKKMREARVSGRMWLIAEAKVGDDYLRWAVIYTIKKRDEEEKGSSPIQCQHVVSFRNTGSHQASCERPSEPISFDEYSKQSPEKIIANLEEMIREIEKKIKKKIDANWLA